MEPFGLFVLPFYQIGRSFSNNFTMSKSIQNRHKRYSFGIVKRYSAILFRKLKRRADSAFRLRDVGRAALSVKGARQFAYAENCFLQQNSRASLAGRPLTDRASLSRFGRAERQKRRTETISLPLGFCIGTLGNIWETLRFPCLFIPAIKAYAVSKKIQEE